MGKCSEKKFPPDGNDLSWRHCGQYNDWQTNPNFCTALWASTRGKDSDYCNSMGGEGEWKLRTPARNQSTDAFIRGGGNSVEALQTVINPSSPEFQSSIAKAQIEVKSERWSYMIGTFDHPNLRSYYASTNAGLDSNKDMGPLFAPSEIGNNPIPLWSNWFNKHGYTDEFLECDYNDWRLNGTQPSGNCCLDGYLSCGIIGGQNVACLRNSFAANREDSGTISCCFNDLVCEDGAELSDRLFSDVNEDGNLTPWSSNDKCFRSGDDDDMRTCKPESRNLGGVLCRDFIRPYCVGEKFFPGQVQWEELWDEKSITNVNEGDFYRGKERPNNINGPCVRLLMRQIAGTNACNQTFDEFQINPSTSNINGFLWSKELVREVFVKYLNEYGSPVLGPNEDGIEASQGVSNFLFQLCQKFPALCEDPLRDLCSQSTEQTLSENAHANQWCGCYMQEAQYEKYTKNLIAKQCTPFCSRDNVIPLVDASYQPLLCQENICIINDVFLKLIKSEGDVNFENVCNNCGKNKTVENINGKTNYVDTSYSYEHSVEGLQGIHDIDPTSVIKDGGTGAIIGGLVGGEAGAVAGMFLGVGGDIALQVVNDSSVANYDYYKSNSVFNTYSNVNDRQISQSCKCTLDGLTLESLHGKFNNINFGNHCGDLNCNDKDGNSIPCSGDQNPDESKLPDTVENIKNIKNLKTLSTFKKLFILGLIILILVGLFYIFFGNKSKIFLDSAGDLISLKKGQSFKVDNGVISLVS